MILKRDNVERIVLTESDKNRLISLGFTVIAPSESVEQPTTNETIDYEELTNKELKALLDAKNVQYNERATKAQLIELLGK